MRQFICKCITRKTFEVDSESVSDNSRTGRKTNTFVSQERFDTEGPKHQNKGTSKRNVNGVRQEKLSQKNLSLSKVNQEKETESCYSKIHSRN